jgi:uncharacterized membrane protein YdjX (TVP38/TMEM64 family)
MALAKHPRLAAIKAVVLILFVVTAIILVRFTLVRDYLTAEKLAMLMERAGFWAPLAYILFFAVGVCLFVPGTLLTTLGAAIFGAYFGFLYVWIGAMLGSSLSFFMGRYLGRDFAASLIADRLKKYDDLIEQNGFATVLYMRLVYFPFTPMNFGMGLTKVRFWDYLFGTALGIIVGTFIITFFVGAVKEVWASGQWGELLGWKTLLAVVMFVFSFFIPKLVERFRASKKIQTT